MTYKEKKKNQKTYMIFMSKKEFVLIFSIDLLIKIILNLEIYEIIFLYMC